VRWINGVPTQRFDYFHTVVGEVVPISVEHLPVGLNALAAIGQFAKDATIRSFTVFKQLIDYLFKS
jgi:hypothetical protein